MPKEIITNGAFQQGDPWVEVGWYRDRSAQIGVRAENSEGTEGAGLFAHLDRETINRLIRVLRKARDQAYGADA